MRDQPELKIFDLPPDDPNIKWLENLLLGGQCWMTAKDIVMTVNGKVLDRDLRALASASNNIISGQKGYKHVSHATAKEINHSANWLISQGKKMIKRGIGQRRNAHKIFG